VLFVSVRLISANQIQNAGVITGATRFETSQLWRTDIVPSKSPESLRLAGLSDIQKGREHNE
jgi:hypothetical protein